MAEKFVQRYLFPRNIDKLRFYLSPYRVASLAARIFIALALCLAVACVETQKNNVEITWVSGDGHCPAYVNSNTYRQRGTQVTLGPGNDWANGIRYAEPGTEILLRDGTYYLTDYTIRVPGGVTIRGASGQRNAVVIKGQGYQVGAEGLMLAGNDITIADLTIRDMRDHGISIKPELGAEFAPHLYNVHLLDIGTQHLKLNNGGTRDGIVACSFFGYTYGEASGDYNGAIDLHGAINWLLRDNVIYNLTGDGSGCVVDSDCGSTQSAPAILVWRGASGTITERNLIINSYRNIAYGLGDGHYGGVIRDNFIYRAGSGDGGIELQNAHDVVVENNTVILGGRYPGVIEYRQSSDLVIRNNIVTNFPWNRGGSLNVEVQGNEILFINADTCSDVAELLRDDNLPITLRC